MDLKDYAEFKELRKRYSDESPQKLENRYIEYFLKNLDIKPIRKILSG